MNIPNAALTLLLCTSFVNFLSAEEIPQEVLNGLDKITITLEVSHDENYDKVIWEAIVKRTVELIHEAQSVTDPIAFKEKFIAYQNDLFELKGEGIAGRVLVGGCNSKE